MYITNNNNIYTMQYNGPHEVKSTSSMGFTVTVRNIVISDGKKIEFENDKVLLLLNNSSNFNTNDENIDIKQQVLSF